MKTDFYPRIVLALGGGGARGLAHIGVLQVLEEAAIPIWGITGTSMGALIGATYAARTNLYYLSKLAQYIKWEDLVDIHLPRLGLVNGDRIQSLIDILTKRQSFEELPILFWAVATDLNCGEAVVFRDGPLTPAIRASISIPGVFKPVELNGRTYVDGGVVAGVPVQQARKRGGDLVFAVNVGFDHTQHKVNNIFDVLAKVLDIMGNKLDAYQIRDADLIIRPELGTIGTLEFQFARECIESGRRAAEVILPQIEQRIAQFRKVVVNSD